MNCDQIAQSNQNDEENKNFELSHIIGLNINSSKSVQCHPSMEEAIIYSVGGIVITEDLTEKNNQVFFRHGKNKINCFKISNSGKYLAVGFTIGEENFDKQFIASIIVWDYENKQIMYEINEIYKAVILLEFSQDDRFLCAAGIDNSFFMWEVATGRKSFKKVFEMPINFVLWTTIAKAKDYDNFEGSKSPAIYDYNLIITNPMVTLYSEFFYEAKTMQYNIKYNNFRLPSTGLVRDYTCGFYDEKFNCLYLGTTGGEIIIFSLDNLFFKCSFNVINNGLTDIIFLPETEEIIVSGGDGKIKKIQRSIPETDDSKDILRAQHLITFETELPGKINAISLTSDRKELVAVSDIGKIFRVLTTNLNYTLHSISHSASVNQVAFNNISKANDICYTVDDNGNMYQYDLNDFHVLGIIGANEEEKMQIIPKCTSVTIGDDQSIFLGYSNGNLKNFTNDLSIKNFEIQAHRGNVTCIYVDGNYILTGGQDGIVRVWTRKTHELVMQVPGHHCNVRSVFADLNKPNVIYSCGEDKELMCFDLKTQKRLTTQSINNGYLTGIDQKIDGDNEIISVGVNCNLCVWDFFKTQPIKELNLEEKFMAIKISHSGKYCALGSVSGELWILRLPEYEFLGKSQGHSRFINNLNWSPDDKQIVSVSIDSSICIWNVYV